MKTVVVDFSNLDDMSGFGEIARNYCPRLAAADVPDLHFIFILPERHCGAFGSHIDYVSHEHLKRDLQPFRRQISLWHATHQQFDYRLQGRGIVHRRSDAVTVISEYVRHDVEAHIPFLNKPLTVIYNGIADIERGAQSRPSFAAEADRFFLCIGQVREKKNIHTLLPMMQHFPGHRLFVCGANHWAYADRLRSMIAPADRDRILLTGKISDDEKRWLYAHAEALLFPSRLEGFGIPVLEAMRFGTKVFSSRYSCLPEICSVHASYWDDYEPEAMARVVREGLAGWSRQGAAAEAAKAYSQSFNYDRYTREYVALYRRLLGV